MTRAATYRGLATLLADADPDAETSELNAARARTDAITQTLVGQAAGTLRPTPPRPT